MLAKIKVTGLDDVLGDLKKMQHNARELAKRNSVSFAELFTRKFMLAHTKYPDIVRFLSAGGFNGDDFDAIPQDALDAFVARNSDFSDWRSMQEQAMDDFISRSL